MSTTSLRPAIDRATCTALDESDPLAPMRERFVLPDGVIYLDGNSPRRAAPAHRRARAAGDHRGVGHGTHRSWNDAGWFAKPRTVGDRIAPLIGADAGEVVLGDSTSASLFQATVAAVRLRPGRRVIVAERGNSRPTSTCSRRYRSCSAAERP